MPVDPADVRKVVLEEKPGGLPLTDPQVQKARAKLFGAWEMNWMAYNYAHDVKLPGSAGAPVAFLMYPQAETGGGPSGHPGPGPVPLHDQVTRDRPVAGVPATPRRTVGDRYPPEAGNSSARNSRNAWQRGERERPAWPTT